MAIGPCILAKLVCAFFMGDIKWVVGWAMVGRAEFAYLIAQSSLSGKLISQDTFAIVIWALLYATIIAPFAFRSVLDRYLLAQEQAVSIADGMQPTETAKTRNTQISEQVSFYLLPENYGPAQMRAMHSFQMETIDEMSPARSKYGNRTPISTSVRSARYSTGG